MAGTLLMTWANMSAPESLESLAKSFGRVLFSGAAGQKLIFVREVPILGQRG
jgi:hypothetical protein